MALESSDNTYVKASSYEASAGNIKKVLLLYSGGLDTSMILKWIKDEYGVDVATLTLDIGQQRDDLEAIRQKAVNLGASEAIVADIKDDYADNYLSKAIKANASYQGDYHLSTPLGRAVCSAKAVEVAREVGADTIAHGSTGKGNDQVRFESYVLANDPNMKLLAPVREWSMDRNEQIAYAEAHDIPIPVSVDFPYSVDDNMWGMTWEGGEVEDPSAIPEFDRFLTTYTRPADAPDEMDIVTLTFEKGIPVAVDGEALRLAELIRQLNLRGGAHGVGVVRMVEDRLIGMKNCGVYEQPGAHIILTAHKALEQYTSTRLLNEIKSQLDIKWAYMCYGAQWFDPAMDAINAFNDSVNEYVSGEVRVGLHKGRTDLLSLSSPFGLAYSSFNNDEGYDLNVNAAPGFIELHSMQMKLIRQVRNSNS